jgi:predicted PurR-regulated permease PerM
MDKNLVISFKTILWTVLLIVAVYILYRLGPIIGVLFISLLLTISLEHTVQTIMRQKVLNKKISRSVAVLITYLMVFGILSIGITIGLDPVISQTQKLVQTLLRNQNLYEIFNSELNLSIADFIKGFASSSGDVLSATVSVFSNVLGIFSVLIMSIYLSIDWENIKKMFSSLFPSEQSKKISKVLSEVEQNVGNWLRGQLILMLAIGILSYVALIAIGVDFALALAILSGIFEIVPVIGPLISSIFAALVAVIDSPVKAILIVAVFSLIQNLEGNILVPKVMQKVSGFSPIVLLLAILIGSSLFGIVGAVVAIPLLMIGVIIFKNYYAANKEE